MKQISPTFKSLRAIIALVAIFTCSLVSAQWYNTATETAYGATVQAIPNDADGTWNVGSGTYTLFQVTEGVKYRFHTTPSPNFDTRITGHKEGESGVVRFYGNTGVIGNYTAVEWVADFTGTLRVSTSRGAGGGWQGGGSGNSHVLRVRSSSNVSVTQPVITATAAPSANKIDLNTKESNTTNLRAYYPFEERSGTTVSDWGPNNYDGTNTSTSAWGEGIAQTSLPGTGSALSLSGGYANIPNADTRFNFGTGDFTFEFWMNGSSFTSVNTYFESGLYTQGILFRQDAPGTVTVYSAGVLVISAAFTPTAGKWYHLALTRSGTTWTIYINGTPHTTTGSSAANVTPAAGGNLAIGSSLHTTGQTFLGRIDEFRVYGAALTENQIIADGLQGFRMFNLNKNTAATQLKFIKTAEYDVNNHYDFDNFENASDDWFLRNAVDPSISTTQQFTGAAGLYMPTGWGGNFEAGTNIESGMPSSYNTDNFPFLSFAYKIPSGTLCNMLINTTAGGWRSITMTQGDFPTSYPILGTYPQSSSIKPMYADNAWHYKTINLREMIGTNQTVNSIIWHDGGGYSGPTGDFYIDDFVASKYPIYNTNDYADNNTVLNPVIDVAAPTAPGAPAITATSSTQLDMSWSAVSDNGTTYYYNAQPHDGLGTVGTAGTTSVVYTKGLDTNPYQVDETSGLAGATDGSYQSTLTYSDGGLSPNTQYCYRVRARDQAVNSSNASAPNESAYGTSTCKYTRATCVTSFTATANTTVCGRIDLAWSGGAWTNVRVRCTTTNADVYTGSGTSFSHTGLTAGTSYSYDIYVRNGDALEEAAACFTRSATTPSLPTITTTGTAAPVCFSTSSQNTTLPYTATTNTPTSYSIVWTGIAAQGSTSNTFSTGAGNVTGIVIPASTAAATYSGTMTLTTANGCTVTQAISVRVDAYPDLSPAANPSPMCDNASAVALSSSVAAVWTVSGNGSFGTATSTSSNNFTPGNITVPQQNATATITLTNGTCVNSTRSIRVDNLNSITTASTPRCESASSAVGVIIGDVNGVTWSIASSTSLTSPAIAANGTDNKNADITYGTVAAPTQSGSLTIQAVNGVCAAQQKTIQVDNQNAISTATTPRCESASSAVGVIIGDVNGVTWSVFSSTSLTSPAIAANGTNNKNADITYGTVAAPTQNGSLTIQAQNGTGICPAVQATIVVNNQNAITTATTPRCESGSSAVGAIIGDVNGVTWSVFSSTSLTSPAIAANGTDNKDADITYGTVTAPTQSGSLTIQAVNGACVARQATIQVDNQNAITTATTPRCESSSSAIGVIIGDVNGVTWSIASSTSLTSQAISANSTNNKNADIIYGLVAAPTQNGSLTIQAQNGTGVCPAAQATIQVDNQNAITGAPTLSPICESALTTLVSGDVNGVTWSLGTLPSQISGSAIAPNGTDNKNGDLTLGTIAGTQQNATLTINSVNGTGVCPAQSATIRVDNNPTAYAGVDQAKCNISFFTMAPTDPTTGGSAVAGSSGVWSCFGGCGGVTAAPTITGQTTGVGSGVTSTMRWTVTNGSCQVTDDVDLRNDQQNSINGNTTLCDAPDAATYTYTSTPASTVWSFDPSTPGPGVGTITSGGIYNPSDIVAPTASMPVIIRAQNGTCTGIINITVYNKPVVSTPSGAAICEGNTLNLASDITPANITWSVTQGPNCTSCLTGTTFVAPNPGANAALYGIDAATGPGCSSTVLFNVDKGLTITGFTSNPMPVCDNSTLTGLASTPAAFWAVTAGGGFLTNVGFPTLTNDYTPPSINTPTQNVTGNIRVTSQNGACVYNFPTRIDNQNTLNTPTTPICESTSAVTNAVVGDVNGVTWSVGMGSGLTGSAATANSGNSKNADVTYGSVATPTQNATLTVTATNGVCTAPSVNIQVDNNNSIITTQTPICETGTSFIDGDVNGVVWTATSGSFTSPAQDITLSGVTVVSGQVDVTVTATNGACPPKTTHVFVDDSPNTTSFSTSATSPLCASGTSAVTINCAALGTGTFTVTYNLSAPNAATGLTASVALTSGTGTFTTGALSATGTTTVTLTSIQNAAGCSATLTTGNTANVVVNAAPTVAITGHEDVCEGTSITLTATPSGGAGSPTNYKWERSSNGGGSWTIVQNTSSATYATSSALTPGSYLYKVTLTQSGSNCSAVSSNVSANVAQQPYANDPATSVDICKGGSTTFTASLTGGGTPSLLYEWVYSDLTSLANGTPTGHTYTNTNTAALTIATDNTTATAGTTSYVLKVYATGTGCNTSFSVDNSLNVFADPTVSAPTPSVQSGFCAGGTAAPISVTAANGTGSYSYQWYVNTTNSNSGGTLISGATAASYSPTVVAGTRYYYAVVSASGNGCGTATSATAEVTSGSSTMTATAAVDECVSVGSLDKYYVLVTASNGTPPYTYTGAVYTSPTGEGVYETSPGLTVNYSVTDAAGCVVTTPNVTTPVGHPTSITLTPSSAGVVTSDCWVSNYNKWVTFRDGVTNEAIMAVNDNQNNLGLVSVSVYKEATAPVILSDQYVNNGGCGGTSTAMRRHFKVTTTAAPTTGVDVALFFSDQEYIDLKNDAFNSNIPYPQQGYECSNDDDVYSFAGLYVTKYSGANEDGNYMNNLPGGLYRVFGDNTTPYMPLTKGEYTGSNTGFQSIYGGSQTHHYVQLTVTEFSEFWLHGSSHGSALPVQMIFFQADAINNSYIRLTWATAIEVNNKGFDVERSIDGQTWTKVSFVEGHNNATTQNNYSYNDMDVTAGVVYYYRLKQVDNDGAFEYTDIVTAKLNGETTFSVKDFIPNPTMDKTNLIITAVKDQEISVVFYNIVGQKVLESNTMVNKGANQLEFSLEKLAAGTYTAVVSAANEVYTKKVVLTK